MSVSCKILGLGWNKHHRMSIPSKNFGCMFDTLELSGVIHLLSSQIAIAQHWTYILQIGGWLETPATCSYMQQHSSWVDEAIRHWLIPFWLDANYVFFRTSHFFPLSSSSPFPHQQINATQTPPQGESGSESSWLTSVSTNAALAGTNDHSRHLLVHHDSAIAASENMAWDAHIQMVCKTRSGMSMKYHVTGCV